MMMNNTPSVAEIDATMNLLTVLELAKDATKLKAALQGVKDAQDEATKERKEADKASAKADAKAKALAAQAAQLEQQEAALRAEAAKIAKASEDTQLDRDAMRDERNAFDRWMAEQREALSAAQARVESDRVANARRAEDLKTVEDAAAKRVKSAEAAIAAADAKREEYEAKLASLKAMVG